ncbi:Poly(A) polymerase [Bonamia ostreae]|uniref:Poly(A) polymerase n=1 Tax=Bonamia ostreae TaxID=126728 RepID=A0ABV2ANT4_9EUKA
MAQNFIAYDKNSENESDARDEKIASNSVAKKMAPWAENKNYPQKSFVLRLHEELIDFYNYMHATKEEHAIRVNVIERIRQLSKEIWPKSETHPYGSFTTDLYLPFSDIDVVILNVGVDPVNVLAEELKDRDLVSHIETITSARVGKSLK